MRARARARARLTAVFLIVLVAFTTAVPAVASVVSSPRPLSHAAIRALAHARRELPVFVCTQSGNHYCATVVQTRAGFPVRNGTQGIALRLFWHDITETPYFMSVGYWQVQSKELALGASSTCASIVLVPVGSARAVTGWLYADPPSQDQWVAFKACNSNWDTRPPTKVWGTTNDLASPWAANPSRSSPAPGGLVKWTEIPAQRKTAHAR